MLTNRDILWFNRVMFQSIAPRPGKIAFEIEPFPVSKLKVISEDSEITVLPVAEPVAVTSITEEAVVEKSAALESSPFMVASEVEGEVVVAEAPVPKEEVVVVDAEICEETKPMPTAEAEVLSVVELEQESVAEEVVVEAKEELAVVEAEEGSRCRGGRPGCFRRRRARKNGFGLFRCRE